MDNQKVRRGLTLASLLLGCLPLCLMSPPTATADQHDLPGSPLTAQTVAPVAATPSAARLQEPSTHAVAIFTDIKALVKEKYPRAKITSTANSMHFDEKCKSEEGYYSQQVALTPQAGGILGDLRVKEGPYEGPDKDMLPSEVENGFHCDLIMAPYSKLENKHLLVSLSFPPDVSTDFKTRFERLVNSYNADERAPEASAPSKAAH